MVPSTIDYGDGYGNNPGRKSQESLRVAYNMFPAVDDKFVEEGTEERLRLHI